MLTSAQLALDKYVLYRCKKTVNRINVRTGAYYATYELRIVYNNNTYRFIEIPYQQLQYLGVNGFYEYLDKLFNYSKVEKLFYNLS